MTPPAPIIERTTPIGRGSVWVWVIADGERVAKLPASVARECGACEGAAFTESLAARAEALRLVWLAERDGVRLLKTRDRSRADLRERLLARGHAPGDVEAALERLAKAGLASDEHLATERVAHFARSGGASRDLLRADLARMGVEERVAEQVVRRQTPASDARTARKLAEVSVAKLPARLTPAAAVRKLMGLLARRGFDHEAASEAIAAAYPPGRDLLG